MSLNLACENVGENLYELSPIQQEMIYKEPLILFDASHVVGFAKLLESLCSKASVQSLELYSRHYDIPVKEIKAQRWKRPGQPPQPTSTNHSTIIS